MEDDLGFKKIEFDIQENNNTNIMEKKSFSAGKLKKVFLLILLVLLVVIGFTVFVGIRAQKVYKNSQKVYAQAQLAYTAMKQQNIVLAKDELVKTDAQITELKKRVHEVENILEDSLKKI